MKKIKPIIHTLICVGLCTAEICAQENMRITSDTPAEWFEESFVTGNGTLGAAVYNGLMADSLSLNDITLWTGEPDNVRRPFSPDAYKRIPEIREALDRRDFRAADSLQKFIQGKYTQNYQPLGKLIIKYSGAEPTQFYRELDISTGVTTAIAMQDEQPLRITQTFCSAPDSAIVVNITNYRPTEAVISLECPESIIATKHTSTAIQGYAAYDSRPIYSRGEGSFKYDANRGVHFLTVLDVECPQGGKATHSGNKVYVSDAPAINIRLTNATSFAGAAADPGKDRSYISKAVGRLLEAKKRPYAELMARHTADMKELTGRVSLYLGPTDPLLASLPTAVQLKRYTDTGESNPALEALYFNMGRYLLASCSRTQGVPANLQGLWNEAALPPWSSNYTTNINLEENYWPAENTNLSELHLPLLDFTLMLSEGPGRDAARIYYGVNRGWCLGQNSDIWGTAAPVGEHEGDPMWANWTMGGAWLASHVWEHYLYTLDREALRKYYPALRGAAEFCADWLVERDGHLITSPGTSPENRYITPDGYCGATAAGMTADIAIARQCMEDALAAARVLDTDKALQDELQKILPQLRPYKTGSQGQLLEWPEDWTDAEPEHRHQSHLYGLFPGRHITPAEYKTLTDAAAKSLMLRGDRTTGWSTGWRINLWARITDGNRAYASLRRLLEYVSPDGYAGADARRGGGTYPNLLDAHSPFQIDGNFGGTAGIAEMLMQSEFSGADGDSTRIHILPALPDAWPQGKVAGLCSRGGYTIAIEWAAGKAVKVRLRKNTPKAAPAIITGADEAEITIEDYNQQNIQ